jgi:hypothetical protein
VSARVSMMLRIESEGYDTGAFSVCPCICPENLNFDFNINPESGEGVFSVYGTSLESHRWLHPRRRRFGLVPG